MLLALALAVLALMDFFKYVRVFFAKVFNQIIVILIVLYCSKVCSNIGLDSRAIAVVSLH
jgi:hypothetical protein